MKHKLGIPNDVPLMVSTSKVNGITRYRFTVGEREVFVTLSRGEATAFVRGFVAGWGRGLR